MLLRTDMATKAETNKSRFVSLVDYVCSNPLHDENETHERMFLRTDMGRCRVQHESLCGCTMVLAHFLCDASDESRFISRVDYVCSNPLHDENEGQAL